MNSSLHNIAGIKSSSSAPSLHIKLQLGSFNGRGVRPEQKERLCSRAQLLRIARAVPRVCVVCGQKERILEKKH